MRNDRAPVKAALDVIRMKRTRTERLLDDLCTDLGFCLPPEKYAQLSGSPPRTVKTFTDAVFIAEGLNPEVADKHLWRQVRDRVTEYFKDMESGNDV